MAYTGVTPDATTLLTWLTSDVQAPWETLLEAEGSTDLSAVSIEAQDLGSPTGGSATVTPTAVGVRTGDFAPASACVVCSWEINRRYRGGHPRTYFPFGTAGTYESGSAKLWDTGFIAACQTAIGTFKSAIEGTSTAGTDFTTLVSVSYYDRVINPVAPYRRTTPVVDPVVALTVKQRICTQRRRLGKALG